MGRYTGPKVRLSRRVGAPIADIPKHTGTAELTLPGMHGYRGRRNTEYGVRLTEKQPPAPGSAVRNRDGIESDAAVTGARALRTIGWVAMAIEEGGS